MRYLYTAIFSPRGDNGYIASVPDVPGCITDGDTLDEAVRMVRDALAGCLCVLEDRHVEIPAARAPQNVPMESDTDVRALIDVDTMKYRAETDNRIVRKNVSIPSWLNARAEHEGINFSQTLQAALKNALGITQEY